MPRVDEILTCDVLVIGGGGGGLRAAVAARAAGADTLVVSKGIVGRSGLTQTAVTGFQVALGHADARDSAAVHEADSLRGSYGLADPALVEVFTAEAASALAAIEAMGARFDRTPDGRYVQRGLDASQTYPRSLSKGDSLGVPIMQALRREAKRLDLRRRDELFVTRLLVEAGRVAGAVALHVTTGQIVHIRAGAVVMAAGGAGDLWEVTSNTPDATGEGYVLALEAGAELVDLEFMLMLGHAVLHPTAVRGVLYTFQYLLPYGARPLFNAQGEEFLHRYDPAGSRNPARHVYARGIFGEVQAGRGSPHGGAWFDPGSLPAEVVHKVLPSQSAFLQRFGVDLRQPIEVGVAAHYMCGGVRIGPDAATTLPGLFAVGEVAGGPHGAARNGGNSLTEILVFGRRAGESAAAWAGRHAAPPAPDAAEAEAARLLALLDRRDGGPSPVEVRARLRGIMTRQVGVVRDEVGLTAAMAGLDTLAEALPHMAPPDRRRACNPGWAEALEAEAGVRLGRALAGAALLRRESRGAHDRADHPAPDPAWACNIRVRLGQDGMPDYHLGPSRAPVAAAA